MKVQQPVPLHWLSGGQPGSSGSQRYAVLLVTERPRYVAPSLTALSLNTIIPAPKSATTAMAKHPNNNSLFILFTSLVGIEPCVEINTTTKR
jgi:hypothetical protein